MCVCVRERERERERERNVAMVDFEGEELVGWGLNIDMHVETCRKLKM